MQVTPKRPWQHSWSAKSRFIPSSCWLEDSKKASRDIAWYGQNTVRPESCLTYQRGPGTCANLHQAVFYNLSTSYLLSLLTKRPQASNKNAFKSFTVFCYLVRKFHFFSRQKATQTNKNTLILWHCFLTPPQCKISLWMKTILIKFIFLSSCQSSLFQPFPPHRSSD